MSKKIDNDLSIGPPVDLSFKCINSMEDALLEEPREGLKPMKRSLNGRLLSKAVRLNNNTLTDLRGFREVIDQLLNDSNQLSWIDLSFNDLPTIDPVLTTYHQLTTLNLHGNSISQLSEVDKFAALPNLKSLSLHGNPIESERGYRYYIISLLPQLKALDFCAVTKQDRTVADSWRRMNIKPKRGNK
ncbi:leucine-rich repeat-containing protein 51 [Bombina bombina]|uniref:leucine-rich repeat-containing protein 51 n=1 Tax=Bombina bombina TaxID=8345 RepID=UPI00235AFA46|nr:leucine-rich repeat-containing protein 51 [Bombina bombina]XP_053564764.1 leucine-rich repeat-containing protein 51 [Bombina bombina]XP_053564766.1 leucine-rich repeat-containing protein 51 [Bombina bombina]